MESNLVTNPFARMSFDMDNNLQNNSIYVQSKIPQPGKTRSELRDRVQVHASSIGMPERLANTHAQELGDKE